MKLLNIQKEIPDILLDIRYCTTYNWYYVKKKDS